MKQRGIVDQSGARGTAMHKIQTKYILEEGYLDEDKVGKQAHNMAIQVIENGLSNVTEYYGTNVSINKTNICRTNRFSGCT